MQRWDEHPGRNKKTHSHRGSRDAVILSCKLVILQVFRILLCIFMLVLSLLLFHLCLLVFFLCLCDHFVSLLHFFVVILCPHLTVSLLLFWVSMVILCIFVVVLHALVVFKALCHFKCLSLTFLGWTQLQYKCYHCSFKWHFQYEVNLIYYALHATSGPKYSRTYVVSSKK